MRRHPFTLKLNLSVTRHLLTAPLRSKSVRLMLPVVIACCAMLFFITSGRTSTAPLVISEVRFRGPNGANDEFVEIYNNTDTDHTVAASDGSSGYALVASDGAARFLIPNGTVIPARGHYLGVNTVAYSLASYPAGSGTTATGDATFTTDIPDNAGVALFSTSNPANFTLGNRFDAVGSTTVGNTLYREGSGFSPLVPFSVDYSFVRKVPSSGGSAGQVQDTNDNAADFLFVDTNGTSAGAGQRLGAPGPENLAGPRTFGSNISHSIIDPANDQTIDPNTGRDNTSDPANNSAFGTLSIRRRFTNNTGGNITRLRFRVIDLSTFPSPSGTADLRPRTSGNIVVSLVGGGTANIVGTTLEQPPSQPNGGGFNSSMSVPSISNAAPLVNGDSVQVQFLLGLQQTGCYKLAVIAEAEPTGGSSVFLISGDSEEGGSCAAPTPTPTPMPTPTPTPTPSPSPTPTPGDTRLIISEFRLRGPNGAFDEFVEIYNKTDVGINVQTFDGSSGYAVAASDGVVRFVIPNGTIIPARGHYLGVNSLAYSLFAYPAGNAATAEGDTTFTNGIADNVGIALFSTSNPANFDSLTRLDAVGPTSEPNGLYREGAGLAPLVPFSIDYSWVRNQTTGLPQDTDDNAADFKFVDTNGTSAGGGQRLGAPGPENLSAPRTQGQPINSNVIDVFQAGTAPPNTVRDFTSDPPNNSTFGTISIRRRFTNSTLADITRLRFRVVDLTTFPAPSGVADLRPRTSGTIVVPLTGGGTTTVAGTTLEQPPSQPNGGGFNSSYSVGSVSPASPLVSGASIDVQFLVGIQQTGCYSLAVVAESFPLGGTGVIVFSGDTETGGPCGAPTPTPTPTPTPSPTPTPTPSPSPSPTPSPTPTPTPGGTTLIISEYRLRGPNGANDEFVEIYNNSNSALNVLATDGSSGFALAASDGVARFVIPNGTIIPARGHYLGANTVGYSLAAYPAGNGTTAVGDATFINNIPDNVGIALFRTATPANFTLANRLDAVGPTIEANMVYREGAGLPLLVPFSVDYSWYRNVPSIGAGAGLPQDTGNNAADFLFVDTNGTSAGGGQRLGAPGPENLSGPGHLNTGASIGIGLVDSGVGAGAPPNFVRDFTSDPANNSTFGTISVRRRFTNLTGVTINRLRVRIIDLTTFPSPSGTADLRPRTSVATVVPLSGGGTTTVQGTTLEQPPSQPNGGGFNSSMSAGTVSLGTPLAAGNSVNLQLLFGVQQEGLFKFCAVVETLPFSNSTVFCASDDTTPPVLTSSVAITSLSQTNSDLVNVGLAATTNEPATITVQVFGDEDDQTPTTTTPVSVHSPDAKDIAVGTLRLRGERVDAGDGRVYLIVVTATDTSGNVSRACHTVVVPRKKKGDTDAQAAAARAFCEANNFAPPPGYFVIGDGPIIGPKQ